MTRSFTMTVNGERVHVTTDPDTPVLSVLRNELDLKGTRFGCGLGICGACFIRMDGDVVPSCETPMWSADGSSVVTVEGLAVDDELSALQRAMLDEQAAQCGFCISGILMQATKLLESIPQPGEDAVAEALDRNLCRCGVQRRIIAAVVKAGGGTSP